jgi:hypothetical protein
LPRVQLIVSTAVLKNLQAPLHLLDALAQIAGCFLNPKYGFFEQGVHSTAHRRIPRSAAIALTSLAEIGQGFLFLCNDRTSL